MTFSPKNIPKIHPFERFTLGFFCTTFAVEECKTNDWKRILYDAPIDEAECFDPGGDNDEIDAFLAIEVLRIVREHEDYIKLMSLLSEISSFPVTRKKFSYNNESLFPTSTTLDEDCESNRERIVIISEQMNSIPPGIESDFDSEEDIINNLLNDDPIPEYERLTFDMEPDVPVINNVDKLNEDECFDPGEVILMLKMTIPSHLSFRLFFRISLTLRFLLYFPPPRMRTPFLTPASPLRPSGISSGWNFHVLKYLSKH
ncbi:hypothetical protein Tco_1173556 [Tanacetum coccineum]